MPLFIIIFTRTFPQEDEVERFRAALTKLEAEVHAKDIELAQNSRLLSNQRDDVAQQLQDVTIKFDALLVSSKTEQSKHWEDLQALKDGEAQLLEESEKLTQVDRMKEDVLIDR